MLSLFGSFLLRSSFALFASLSRHKPAAHACWDFGIWTGKMLPSHSFRWKRHQVFAKGRGRWGLLWFSIEEWTVNPWRREMHFFLPWVYVQQHLRASWKLRLRDWQFCTDIVRPSVWADLKAWGSVIKNRCKTRFRSASKPCTLREGWKGRKRRNPLLKRANKPKERILGQTICMLSLEKRLVVVIRQLKPFLMPPGA